MVISVSSLLLSTILARQVQPSIAADAVLSVAWGFFFFLLIDRLSTEMSRRDKADEIKRSVDNARLKVEQELSQGIAALESKIIALHQKENLNVVDVDVKTTDQHVLALDKQVRHVISFYHISTSEVVRYIVGRLPHAHTVYNTFVADDANRDDQYGSPIASDLRSQIVKFVCGGGKWTDIMAKDSTEIGLMANAFRTCPDLNGIRIRYRCCQLLPKVGIKNFTIIEGTDFREVLFGGRYHIREEKEHAFFSQDHALVESFHDYFRVLESTCQCAPLQLISPQSVAVGAP